jgi:competence protein ComEC
VLALLVSSIVAGAATAPFGAAHFNLFSRYGLVANLLAVPVMGSVVVPAAVVAGLLAPLGLEALPLWVMGQGLNWILGVAAWVADWPGAAQPVVQPPVWVLPVLALSGLWLALWNGWARWLGLIGAMAVGVGWAAVERSVVLVSEDGGLVGVMTAQGRALSRAKGSGFVAEVWLENDGQGLTQPEAAALWSEPFVSDGTPIRHVTGKRRVAELECAAGDVVVVNAAAPEGLPCQTIGPEDLRETGSLALIGGEWHSAREWQGDRIWTPWGRAQ